MSIEEKLQNHIVEAYGSVNQFCIKTGIASGTIFGVFSRGINKTSTSTILRVCKNLRIDPNDNDLSLEANGVLSKMLNNPDTDYVKAVDLCAVCENDSLRTIKKALSELTDKGYLLRIGNTYAVNKVRITQMKLA
jgi:hypothetical protein